MINHCTLPWPGVVRSIDMSDVDIFQIDTELKVSLCPQTLTIKHTLPNLTYIPPGDPSLRPAVNLLPSAPGFIRYLSSICRSTFKHVKLSVVFFLFLFLFSSQNWLKCSHRDKQTNVVFVKQLPSLAKNNITGVLSHCCLANWKTVKLQHVGGDNGLKTTRCYHHHALQWGSCSEDDEQCLVSAKHSFSIFAEFPTLLKSQALRNVWAVDLSSFYLVAYMLSLSAYLSVFLFFTLFFVSVTFFLSLSLRLPLSLILYLCLFSLSL